MYTFNFFTFLAAIGAAPVKAATKAKARKPSNHKARKSSSIDPPFQFQAASSPTTGSFERRSRRTPKGTPKGLALAESLKRNRFGADSLPSSPIVARSVLDMHRYLAHDVTSSASDDDARSWQEDGPADNGGDHVHDRHHQRYPPSGPYVHFGNGAHSSLATATSLPVFSPHQQIYGARRIVQQQMPVSGQIAFPRRASSTGLVTLATDFLQGTSDAWGSDAWADAVLNAATARQAPPAGISAVGEDDDVMLLPVDLSAFDHEASALL